ncbi:MAG TPA: hypothetical protein VN924_05380 [Bryobacteraceae bacterium]|jgi:hypothetical protein|nr:hypothetical protein [Bryobacteraceae bacterium]
MLIVVGGHSRNIGKTSVVAGIIQALPQFDWTAMKITQFGHGICSASGKDCGCCLASDHPYAIAQERHPGRSDTGRFVAAGARHSYWVRTATGQLANALPAVREVRAASRNLIVESNSIVEFLTPDLYLVVLDFAQGDFKPSSRRFLDRADACVVIERDMQQPFWNGVALDSWNAKPRFPVRPPQYVTPALTAFVNERLLELRSYDTGGTSA